MIEIGKESMYAKGQHILVKVHCQIEFSSIWVPVVEGEVLDVRTFQEVARNSVVPVFMH